MTLITRRLLLSLLLVLVVPEMGTRVWLSTWASEESVKSYASLAQLEARHGPRMFSEHRYLGMVPTAGYEQGSNRHNSDGLRGEELEHPKPDGQFRIACVGASMSYTSQVEDWRSSYPAVLEAELARLGHENVKVLNSGCNNWTSFESLIHFQLRLVHLEPDLVIVYHAPNDLKARFVWPPEQFRSDNSGYMQPAATFVMVPLHEHSAFLRFLAVRFGGAVPHSDLRRHLAPVTPDSRWAMFARQVRRGTFPAGFFRKTRLETLLATNTNRYFEHNLTELIGSAERARARVVLATFVPCPPEAFLPGEAGRRAIALCFDQMNASIERVAEETSAELYDFASEMPRDASLFADDLHVNVEGARVKGELFARFLHGSGWLPR